MNSNFITIIIASCFLVIILPSCESHAQKTDDAFENFKEEKMKQKDSNIINKTILKEQEKAYADKKAEPIKKNSYSNGAIERKKPDEWAKFKIEMGKKILANENNINEIKNSTNASGKSYRKVIRLEKSNNNLRQQMDEYSDEVKVKWEKFQSKINQDENDINNELQSLK